MKQSIIKATVCVMTVIAAAALTACGPEKKPAKQMPAGVKEKSTAGLSNYRPPKIDTAGLLAKAKDGTYQGLGKPDGEGEYTKLTLVIENHKIKEAKFEGFLKGGKLKDADYGKTNGKVENKVYYNKAQLAVRANNTYAEELVKKQDLNKVDAVSGATISYKGFFEAGQTALEKAIK